MQPQANPGLMALRTPCRIQPLMHPRFHQVRSVRRTTRTRSTLVTATMADADENTEVGVAWPTWRDGYWKSTPHEATRVKLQEGACVCELTQKTRFSWGVINRYYHAA